AGVCRLWDDERLVVRRSLFLPRRLGRRCRGAALPRPAAAKGWFLTRLPLGHFRVILGLPSGSDPLQSAHSCCFPRTPMATSLQTSTRKSLADVLHALGDVPPERIRFPVGGATEADVIKHLEGADKRIYELIDGVLVEKVMGFWE